MPIVIFTLCSPIIPLLIYRGYNRNVKWEKAEILLRYMSYLLSMTVMMAFIMAVLCEEGTSFWVKVDSSAGFVVKYIVAGFAVALFTAFLEWIICSRKIQLDVSAIQNGKIWKHFSKFIVSYGLYLLAGIVALFNILLIFDNVLWGDEAFSAMTVNADLKGIFQIIYYWDSHPPLYYLWLKLLVTIFGMHGWVMHLASVIPFLTGIVIAVTLIKRYFGKMAAAFFVVISGLATPCLEYNQEIRMYAFVFFAMLMAFLYAYRVVSGSRGAWFGMVLWALIAGYSHYYGYGVGGILLFITGVVACIKYRKKTWIKAVLSLLTYIVCYIPWVPFLLHQMGDPSVYWYDTILPLRDALTMIGAGASFRGVVWTLVIALTLTLITAESHIFVIEQQEEKTVVRLQKPSLRDWSAEAYTCAIGCLTIFGTLCSVYLICYLFTPTLSVRYLYLLIAVTVLVLGAGCGGVLRVLREAEKKDSRIKVISNVVKTVFALMLCVLLVRGIGNYRTYSNTVKAEAAATEEILNIMGDLDEDVKLVNFGVKHIGWTVLQYYYPENEVINNSCYGVEDNRFWFFIPYELTEGEIAGMEERGYMVSVYGAKQLGKYPLFLYYFER